MREKRALHLNYRIIFLITYALFNKNLKIYNLVKT